jgi:thiol-disulfide isomerase/thioredoxin
VLALAGCTGSGKSTTGSAKSAPAAPFADCAALSTAPTGTVASGTAPTGTAPTGTAPTGTAAAGAAAAGGSGGGSAVAPTAEKVADKPLPDLKLPCFTGGQTIDVGQIHGPAILTLWASWCAPCRQELPIFQRYAQRAASRVHVVGVDSSDGRENGRSLGADLGVTFPTVFDEKAALLGRVGRTGLPVTVFVDSRSQISYTYNAEPLTEATLNQLAQRYLGVAA